MGFRLSHRFSFFLLAVAHLSPAEETEEEGKGEGRGEGRGLYDLVGVLVECLGEVKMCVYEVCVVYSEIGG